MCGGVLLRENSTRCRCKFSLTAVLADLLRPGTLRFPRDPLSPWSCWHVRVNPPHMFFFFTCALGVVVNGRFSEVSPRSRSARR